MKRLTIAALLLSASLTAFARPVAIVNGEPIEKDLIDGQIQTMRQQTKGQIKDTPQLRSNILNHVIVHAVIVQEARRLKLDAKPEYRRIVNQALSDAHRIGEDKKPNFAKEYAVFRENLLEQAYRAYVLETNPVTDAQLRAEYQNLANYYKGSQEILIGQIITRTPQDARNAINDLRRGVNFKQVASRYTVDPEGRKNGGVPTSYINLNDLQVAAPSLFNLVKSYKVGQFTQEPLQAGNVFAIFQVMDTRAASVPSYKSVRETLLAQLEDERVNKAVDALVRRAKIQRMSAR